MIEDLRHSILTLIKNRGFALAAILSLGLGIGANTTIFTFINAIFLQPLPVTDPVHLTSVVTLDSKIPGYLGSSYPNFRDYRDRNQTFSSLLLYGGVVGTLSGLGDPRPLDYEIVSGNYFQTLGVKPALGRPFLPEEDGAPGGHPVAVISHDLWTREFGSDPQITGRTVGINGHVLQIVGVAPAGFRGLNLLLPTSVWVPMAMYRELYPIPAWINLRRALVFSVVGRLKPDVTPQRAEAELQSLAQELARQYPKDNQGRTPKLIRIGEAAITRNTRNTIANSGLLLMIVAGLTLLIACANVANLLLARSAGRNKEIAVRIALGASRWRLVRQLLTESLVLSLAGAAFGLLLAHWASALLWAVRPPMLTKAALQIGLDSRVLGFTFAVALLTGLLFGLAPALRATNPDLATDLKERAGQPASGSRGRHPRSLLVAAEVALCVVALIGAGLFIRSLSNAERIDPGFDADHIGMVSVNLSDRYNAPRGREFQRRVLEQTASIPGITSVALAHDRLFRVSASRTVIIEGDSQAAEGRSALVSPVSMNYFRTTGIALTRGRDFSALDTQETPRIAIVNEAAAARFWPGSDPIGRSFHFSGESTPLQVVGIARTASYLAVGEPPQALIYTSLLQEYSGAATLIYRASGRPETVESTVRRTVQTLDPNLPAVALTVRAAMNDSLWAPRLSAGLLSVFGLLGLALATLGVYGVVSYSVNQRRREIGVRMALGASGNDVQVLILRQGLAVVTVGVVAGLLIALGASRTVQSLLFVTSARDALTFVLVPSILILAAIVACWLPARRATRIDPAIALRDE